MNTHTITTRLGQLTGLDCGDLYKYLGIRYAATNRFEYATPITNWNGNYDATTYGDACIQKRVWYEHLEVPERLFYHNEFRKGIAFNHSEDCLNLNIFTPKAPGTYPVLVFIHGGGFDSGCNYDTAIDGTEFAKKGIVFISINYRVGIFGYLTHSDIKDKYGHDGNFGLDDQYIALRWIKDNIADFGGDDNNITVMGQSAGAISIQYLCLSQRCKGLFQRAIMMSGAGLFPKFSLPRPSENTHEYWLDVMNTVGATSLEELKAWDAHEIFTALEEVKGRRKDNTFNTMPVIDGYLIERPIDEMIASPLDIDYMVGFTNNDMFAFIMSHIAYKYVKANHGYLYYFDIDAPGEDKNGAFHSSDIRYVFGTLDCSHRPYSSDDKKVSRLMIDYIFSFCLTGNPNHTGAPMWENNGRALHIVRKPSRIKMGPSNKFKLLWNTITKGDPK